MFHKDRWLTTTQAAKKIGKTRSHVVYLILTKQLRGVKAGRDWFVDANSAESFKPRKPGRKPKS